MAKNMRLNGVRVDVWAPYLCFAYLALICAILLDPFDFSAPSRMVENGVTLAPDGIHFGTAGILGSPTAVPLLHQRVVSGGGLTIELWLNTASADQVGPARLISYSLDPWHSNFTLGQDGTALDVRLRTTHTDANGTNPQLTVPDVLEAGTTQHVVVSYDFDRLRVHVDGKLRAAATVPQGDFRVWDPSCLLAFGNEVTGARPWRGTIYFAAIYDRPLPDDEITSRFEGGLALAQRRGLSPLLEFDFSRGPGSWSTVLEKRDHVETLSRLAFSMIRGGDGRLRFGETLNVWDMLANVVLFWPFGFLLAAAIDGRPPSTAWAVVATIAVGFSLSASCEGAQIFLASRMSSAIDVAANTVGTLCGALAYVWIARRLRSVMG
jgi:hypothetical protein